MGYSTLYLTLLFATTTLVSAALSPRASPDAYACKVCPAFTYDDGFGPYPFQTEYTYPTYVICQYYNSGTNFGKDCIYSTPSGSLQAGLSEAGCPTSLSAASYTCPLGTASSGSYEGGALTSSQSVSCVYVNLQYTCNFSQSNGVLVPSESDGNCASALGTQAPSCASLPGRRRRRLDNMVAAEQKREERMLAPPVSGALPVPKLTRSAMKARAKRWNANH